MSEGHIENKKTKTNFEESNSLSISTPAGKRIGLASFYASQLWKELGKL